jgi:NADH:ubiquinone oxidoreductase subunit 6 (subunit J)
MLISILGIFAIVFALMAAVVGNLRYVTLALWMCNLFVGAIYLSLGSEFLAVVQWIVASLMAIAFLFYAVLFGTSHPSEPDYRGIGIASLPGVSFVSVFSFLSFNQIGADVGQHSKLGLAEIGTHLLNDYFLPTLLVSLLIFLAIVGIGIVSRPGALER